jgi:hypothetical protein
LESFFSGNTPQKDSFSAGGIPSNKFKAPVGDVKELFEKGQELLIGSSPMGGEASALLG